MKQSQQSHNKQRTALLSRRLNNLVNS